MILDPRQPGRPHPRGQLLALRELADAGRKIIISRLMIPGQGLSDPRQHAMEIPAIERAKRPERGHGEFQHGHASAGAANAGHLPQPAVRIAHVPQPKGDANDLELVVGEGQLLGVGFEPGDLLFGPGAAALLLGQREHGLAEIGAHDLGLAAAGLPVGQGQVAGAGADIEDRPAVGPGRHEANSFPPPGDDRCPARARGSADRTARRSRRTSDARGRRIYRVALGGVVRYQFRSQAVLGPAVGDEFFHIAIQGSADCESATHGPRRQTSAWRRWPFCDRVRPRMKSDPTDRAVRHAARHRAQDAPRGQSPPTLLPHRGHRRPHRPPPTAWQNRTAAVPRLPSRPGVPGPA